MDSPRSSNPTAFPRLLILGASTRAAAWSAVRGGFHPVCGDLFADADLRSVAEVLDVADYPHGLERATASLPRLPWMYTGALENAPDLVDAIARRHVLWGNDGQTLRACRDPWRVAGVVQRAGLPSLSVWPRTSPPPPADGTWMRKPRRGAAGRGVCVWDGSVDGEAGGRDAAGDYFQRRRDGVCVSAQFLGMPGQTLLLGITQQLVGEPGCLLPFGYCGTIAPLRLPREVIDQMAATGTALAGAFALRGLFGCDFMLSEQAAWLTEINPRYTAAMELIECGLGVPLVDWHRRACGAWQRATGDAEGNSSGNQPERDRDAWPAAEELDRLRAACLESPSGASIPTADRRVWGKLVVYADREVLVGDTSAWVPKGVPARLPPAADIPATGQRIACGEPICTVFARGRSVADCRRRLLRRGAKVRQWCWGIREQ